MGQGTRGLHRAATMPGLAAACGMWLWTPLGFGCCGQGGCVRKLSGRTFHLGCMVRAFLLRPPIEEGTLSSTPPFLKPEVPARSHTLHPKPALFRCHREGFSSASISFDEFLNFTSGDQDPLFDISQCNIPQQTCSLSQVNPSSLSSVSGPTACCPDRN